MQLRPGELNLMRQVIESLTGVSLTEDKGYLIEARLGPIAEEFGCGNFNELYFELRYSTNKDLVAKAVDAITTHETSFFRDMSPFEALQFKLLPEVIEAREKLGQKTLRIWSAACSTGQEPYSIAMVIHSMLGMLPGWSIEIVATDISQPALDAAMQGIYSPNDISRSTRPELMDKFFRETPGGYQVIDELKQMITWRQANLQESTALLGDFDIVFLRNVLIYFEGTQRARVANEVANRLLPHGWLVAGGSEHLGDISDRFQPETHCRTIVYQPNRQPV